MKGVNVCEMRSLIYANNRRYGRSGGRGRGGDRHAIGAIVSCPVRKCIPSARKIAKKIGAEIDIQLVGVCRPDRDGDNNAIKRENKMTFGDFRRIRRVYRLPFDRLFYSVRALDWH